MEDVERIRDMARNMSKYGLRTKRGVLHGAADELERIRTRVDVLTKEAEGVMDIALCEAESLVLREGQLYRFWKVGDCEKCAAKSVASSDAYGAPPMRPASMESI